MWKYGKKVPVDESNKGFSYDQLYINSVYLLQFFVNYSFYFIAAAFASGNVEYGIAFELENDNKIMVFEGKCDGWETDIGMGAEIILGFWRKLDDIPGFSTAFGLGFDTPVVNVGAGVSLTVNEPQNEVIGISFDLGVGLGMDFFIYGRNCY